MEGLRLTSNHLTSSLTLRRKRGLASFDLNSANKLEFFEREREGESSIDHIVLAWFLLPLVLPSLSMTNLLLPLPLSF